MNSEFLSKSMVLSGLVTRFYFPAHPHPVCLIYTVPVRDEPGDIPVLRLDQRRL